MKRILIVDDDELNLLYLGTLLTGHGFEVDTARGGEEALKRASETPPDLVVSDLLMPTMNGYKLLRLWLADERLNRIPFIVYTATFTDPKDERLALDLGAAAFILKGTEPEQFMDTLSRVLGGFTSRLDRSPAPPALGREELEARYSEALVRKIEARNIQLMEANRSLQAEVVERTELAETQIAILNALPAHIALIDPDGVILAVNESWRRFASDNLLDIRNFGVGENYLQHCEGDTGECTEGSQEVAANIRKVLTCELPRFTVEYPCHSPSKQQWFRMIASPLRGSLGGGAVILHIDITERKEIELDLIKSREHSLLLLNSTAEGIFGLDIHGACTFGNPAAASMLGYEHPTDMVGKRLHALHHHSFPDDSEYPVCECAIQRSFLKDEKCHVSNEVFFRLDGTQFPVEYWSYPIRNQTEIVGSVITFIDITERRSLELQLLQAQKMEAIAQLSGGVAHDFNNLLTVVLGCAELLIGEMTEDDAQRSLAETIRTAALRAAELTHRMLSFGRRQVLTPRVIELGALLGDMKVLLGRTLPADIEISLIQEPNLWKAMADPVQAESAVLNVVLNARDAMPHGGLLTLALANVHLDKSYAEKHFDLKPGSYVLLSISDTGVGIPPTQLDHIFEPFFTTKEVGKGTGLGLSMVYGFVKQSGGHVEVFSEPGMGTTVKLYLPKAGMATDESEEIAVSISNLRGSEKILVVEDDSAVLGFAAERLTSLGYSIIVSANGKEALDVIRSNQDIDLLFTDVVMPGGISGTELADAARKLQPALKVLFTSGYAEDAFVNREWPDKSVHLLLKPYSQLQLAEKIRLLLTESLD
jgi:PAS domain S-box-containing protein